RHVIAVNKNARRNYEILVTVEAGIELLGCEVKSIRAGGINLKESYIRFKHNECFLVGCHISPYKFSPLKDYDPVRDRRLLFHRHEIKRLNEQVQQKGLTIVPLRAAFSPKGRCKIEVGVGRGKKLFDKREDIKAREAARDIERAMKR
ncbi:MAG TPA: SsrA-binding protein SmpB, partial [Oligoflexia bacterium]|nr:SsrA-binding protein SmpB [Oligoflexia bacterium]